MRSPALKIIIGFIAAVFLIHQVYSSVYKPITTSSAEFCEMTDGLSITGVLIREETLIQNSTDGVLHFVTADGSRVAKSGVIANIYDTASSSLTMSRIDELSRQIKSIEEITSYNNVQAADLDLMNEKVSEALNDLVYSCSDNNYSDCSQLGEDLLTAINRRQMLTGEVTDFSERLNSLKSELASFTASLPNAKGTVKAPLSGYFVSGSDGYEPVLKCTELDKLTPEFLKNITPQSVPENTVGKIVSDYEWYIAATVSLNDSLKYKEGDSLTIRTVLKSAPELQVKVKKINISNSSDRAVVIFSCQQMNSEIACMRSGAMTIVKKVYTGLKISTHSLHFVNNTTGVYVLSGAALKYVPVNVIYRDSDYAVCEQVQTNNDDVLRLYDEVVVKGKKLYDGKIID